MRAGWMRPSAISRSIAWRATSRRNGSKLERMIAPGVSSTISSTPVAVSSARMLRPSRPMMRPFRSSLGRSTTETVVSMACSAALRWMASVMICCARSGGGLARLGLEPLDEVGGVAPRVGFDLLEQQLARLVGGQAGDALQLALPLGDELFGARGGRGGALFLLRRCAFSRPRRSCSSRSVAASRSARARVLSASACSSVENLLRAARAPAVRLRRRARAPSRAPRARLPCGALSASRSACRSDALGLGLGAADGGLGAAAGGWRSTRRRAPTVATSSDERQR